MKKTSLLVTIIFLFVNCLSNVKTKPKTTNTSIKNKNLIQTSNKQKVFANNYKSAVIRTTKFANNLDFNLDYIREKGLPDKKYLAEFLGLYLKLNKAVTSVKGKEALKKRIEPFYQKTLDPKFHNMALVNDKLFKKNSMSYMRIMWLLQKLDFDITFYKQELAKVQKRMDKHMKVRGEWQRAVFDKYYDFFKLKKPIELQNAKKSKGPIGLKKPISFYTRTNAYILTHFVFAAYDYGNKQEQIRFNTNEIKYLKDILPQIIKKFELKNNDDIVAELLTCQVFIGDTNTKEFKTSYARLLSRQNKDGSFGSYERVRKKIGNDVEFRQYLHTTLVALETLVEFEDRKHFSS